MATTFFISLATLLLTSVLLRTVFDLPKNIVLLFFAQPLVWSVYPVVVFVGGILTAKIAPTPSLATLPLTMVIISMASASIPAALLAKRLGRRKALLIGLSFSVIGSLLAMYAAMNAQFWLFITACCCYGVSLAFIQQMRFAAMESVKQIEDIPKVLSILLFTGIFAAFLGPELVLITQSWFSPDQEFAGVFLALTGMALIAMLILTGFNDPQIKKETLSEEPRPLAQIIKQPIFIIAIIISAVGYGLMSYLMTATPISMHHFSGHSLDQTKWVIQSHIIAMYLPSLLAPWLVKRFGLANLAIVGSLLFAVVAIIALAGQHVIHYWWALVLLGIGWNFLFLTGTSLLPSCYQSCERHKVQAANDFLIFFCQGLFSLLAGWLLFKTKWDVLIYTSLPLVALVLFTSIYYRQLDRQQ